MSVQRKGLLLGVIHILMMLSFGGKLLYDPMTRPRVWVLSGVYAPDSPIRGRYLSEQLLISAEGFTYTESKQPNYNEWCANCYWACLEVRNNELIAKHQGSGTGQWIHLRKNPNGTLFALTENPVLVFIPERADLPNLKRDERLWVEVTIPAKGPPRPIRIGVNKDGVLTPVQLN